MPQTTDNVAAYWAGSEDFAAQAHLKERSFVIDKSFTIHLPSEVPPHDLSERDEMAIALLCEEWDYAYSARPWGLLDADIEIENHG